MSIFETLKAGDAARIAMRKHFEAQHKPVHDLMLKSGRYWQGRELPAEYEHLTGETQRCFLNALTAAEVDPRLTYYEGFYTVGGSEPRNHGWCVTPAGEILELTFPTRYIEGAWVPSIGPWMPPRHWAYWGVPFDTDYVRWHYENYLLGVFYCPHDDHGHVPGEESDEH